MVLALRPQDLPNFIGARNLQAKAFDDLSDRLTCMASLLTSIPAPIRSESSSPTRTLPSTAPPWPPSAPACVPHPAPTIGSRRGRGGRPFASRTSLRRHERRCPVQQAEHREWTGAAVEERGTARFGMDVMEPAARGVIGVDAREDLHVAAVVDERDRVLGTRSFARRGRGTDALAQGSRQTHTDGTCPWRQWAGRRTKSPDARRGIARALGDPLSAGSDLPERRCAPSPCVLKTIGAVSSGRTGGARETSFDGAMDPAARWILTEPRRVRLATRSTSCGIMSKWSETIDA